MCLNRKKIYTNAHHILWDNMQPYVMEVPCGKCTQCEETRQNEWTVRTYYEYQRCIKEGGQVLWDCLTYRDESLPHLNDIEENVPEALNFTCFNKKHVQDWVRRIRSELEARNIATSVDTGGRRPKSLLKFLIAGEYGQEEGRTKRPHYHVIMFNNTECSPGDLSRIMSDEWDHGHCNGIRWNESNFWRKGIIQDEATAIQKAKYIGKYCLKNQDYDAVAEEKVQKLCRYWYRLENNGKEYEGNLFKCKEWRKKKETILRKVKTFHTNSNEYGTYALEAEGAINNMAIGMPDNEKVSWWTKLPKYLERKLYWEYTRIDKHIVWKLNEAGKAWKSKNLVKTIQMVAKAFEDKEAKWNSEGFRRIVADYYKEKKGIYDDSRWRYLMDLLFAYRNGRQWWQYAEYIIWYKGRILPRDERRPSPWEILDLNKNASTEAYFAKNHVFHNYCHVNDQEHFGFKFASEKYLGDSQNGYKELQGEWRKPEQIEKEYCVNQDTWIEFNDFDDLGHVIEELEFYEEYDARRVQRTLDTAKDTHTYLNQ